MDTVSKARRSEIMSRIRSKDTRPEIVVRSTLHRMGFRFRLHSSSLPGKPDIVLPKYKTVISVHGYFWQGCNLCDKGCRIPKTNRDFWLKKVAENRTRDRLVNRELRKAGWRVLRIWEHQLSEKNRGRLLPRIRRAMAFLPQNIMALSIEKL